MRTILKIFIILLSLQLTHCIYAQKGASLEKGTKLPVWVNAPYDVFPQSQYIVGVGSGDTREAAEKNAVSEIAKVFQSNIQVDETLIESALEHTKGNRTELTTNSQMYNQTQITSNLELKNIKVERVFFSEKEGMYYALAVLNRAETAQLYRKDFNENDQLLQKYFRQAEQESNKLHKLSDLNKSYALFEVNRLINEKYKVLTGGQSLQPSVSENQLKQALRKAREAIAIQLQAAPGTPKEVGDYLKELIGNLGFKISDKPADFVLRYQLERKPTNLNRPGIVAFNWQLTVQLSDRINNVTLKTFTVSKRTAAISEGEANARILRTVKMQLQNRFYRQFLDYLNSF
ncbi:hypothetical protein DRI50_03585 [candidate division KSB1 bacterium]|nr:MAG: hypothetical protein DRI50_03585 [candidate division KSB1 bacterium]